MEGGSGPEMVFADFVQSDQNPYFVFVDLADHLEEMEASDRKAILKIFSDKMTGSTKCEIQASRESKFGGILCTIKPSY